MEKVRQPTAGDRPTSAWLKLLQAHEKEVLAATSLLSVGFYVCGHYIFPTRQHIQIGKDVATISSDNVFWTTLAISFLVASLWAFTDLLIRRNSFDEWVRADVLGPIDQARSSIDGTAQALLANSQETRDRVAKAVDQANNLADQFRTELAHTAQLVGETLDISISTKRAGLANVFAHATDPEPLRALEQIFRSQELVIGVANGLGFWLSKVPDALAHRLEKGYPTIFILPPFYELPEKVEIAEQKSYYTAESVARYLALSSNSTGNAYFLEWERHPLSLVLNHTQVLTSPYSFNDLSVRGGPATPLFQFVNVPSDEHNYFKRLKGDLERLVCPTGHESGPLKDLKPEVEIDARRYYIPASEKYQAVARWAATKPSFSLPLCMNCQRARADKPGNL